MTTYLLAGGGTAGHVNPLLAIADRLRARDPEAELIVLGTAEGIEARLVPERGYELVTIPRTPMPRRPNADALRFPARWRTAVRAVERLIAERGVDVVFGVGGYASAPAYVAAHRRRVPIAIHEANARPGWANRLGARYARQVGVAFPDTPIRGAVFVGQPLRPEIERLADAEVRSAARVEAGEAFGLDPARPTLLVTGGSSGALRINATITAAIDDILQAGWQILHASGEFRDEIALDAPGYRAVRYLDRMDLALALADCSLGRSGTGTVAETAALGIPAVFIPYTGSNGEQRLNAAGAVAAGGALLVEDAQFTPDWVRSTLIPLLGDRERLSLMSQRIRSVGAIDGTDRMVALIDAAAGQRA